MDGLPRGLVAWLTPALASLLAVAPSAQGEPHLVRRIEGRRPADYFGVALAGGGDVDHDGMADCIVGAYDYTQSLPFLSERRDPLPGRVSVFSGRDGTLLLDLESPSKSCMFGLAVADLGDANGDGHADILVGSPALPSPSDLGNRRRRPGRAFVYSGSDGSVLTSIVDQDGVGSFGWSVAGIGDVNGDGHADLAVSADTFVSVHSGEDGSQLFRVELDDGNPLSGPTLLGRAGDVDGDGVPDLVLGRPYADGGARDAGEARLVSGKTGAILRSWQPDEMHGLFGSAVCGVGDLNEDGHGEILIGATGLDRSGLHAGGAFVYSGKDGAELFRIDGPRAGLELGVSCAALGDVSGDGIPDFALGAAREGSGPFVPGRVRVYSGQDASLLFEVEGITAAAVGDVTGDGRAELATGVPDPGAGKGEKTPGLVRVWSLAAR